MKNYIPLKVEFCLYENLLCGRILQQDDRLITLLDRYGGVIAGDNCFYPHHISILNKPDLCNYTLYLRGSDKCGDNDIFYYEYNNKQDAETALKNFKELITQINDCYNETDITEQKNTYYVEVCE